MMHGTRLSVDTHAHPLLYKRVRAGSPISLNGTYPRVGLAGFSCFQPLNHNFLASSRPRLMSQTKLPKVHYNSNPCLFNPHDNYSAVLALDSSSINLSNSPDDLITTQNNNAPHVKALEHVLSQIIGEDDPIQTLNFIDTAQRLGIENRFQTEIDAILESHYDYAISATCGGRKSDLHEVALRFRLLRQRGCYVPSDVFKVFLDKEGNFNQGLEQDIKGLMSLYEASKLCLPGEVMLEEAGKFSLQILRACVTRDDVIDSNQAAHVAKTLANPYHTSLSKFMVKDYFGVGDFPATYKWTSAFQQLAKKDFNMVQNIHRQELFQFSQWWEETGLAKALRFARDQPLKWYICSWVCLTDPSFSKERIDLSKPISFVYLIDDMFDVYGSLDQLRLFAEAVRRWDLGTAETLPDCMKICFKSLYDMTNEISSKIVQNRGWNPIDSLQKSWAKLCDAFLVETEWFVSGYSPSAEEYLKNGVVSSGVHVVLVHVFFLLGEGISRETVQLLDSNPDLISSAATILRLQDDLGSAKDENQEGYDGSYVNYYMIDNEDASLESAREHVADLIFCAWKKLNRECLSPNPFPLAFTEASLNIARFVPVLYGYDGNQNLPTLKKLVKSMLYERVQM